MSRVPVEIALGEGELVAGWGLVWLLLLCAGVAVWWAGAVGASGRRARAMFPRPAAVGEAGGITGAAVGVGGPRGRGGGRGGRGVGLGEAAAAWVWWQPPEASGAPPVSGAEHVRRRLLSSALFLPTSAIAVGVLVAVWQRSVLPLIAGVVGVLLVRRWSLRRERRREAEHREAAVVELCVGVAAELRAGRQPHAALLAVGVSELGTPEAGVLAAARFGGDVPAAFRRASIRPGGAGLGGVAACWQVAAEGGAGLAAGLDRVACALRVERDQREELRAQLAGPRATVVILAGLPLLGVVLGTAMGADPLGVLLHTTAGWALLAGVLVLELLGIAWVRGIVRSAEGAGLGVRR